MTSKYFGDTMKIFLGYLFSISILFSLIQPALSNSKFCQNYKDCQNGIIEASIEIATKTKIAAKITEIPIDNQNYIQSFYFDNGGERLILLSSGVHGIEGPVGASMQIEFMKNWHKTFKDLGFDILYLFAVNPWGVKNKRRVNADNIDLNRNFIIDGDYAKQKNLGYLKLSQDLNPESQINSNSLFEKASFYFKFIIMALREGVSTLRQAIVGGQYEVAKGIFFGGKTKSKSYIALEKYFTENQFNKLEMHIDFHTGYGERGKLHVWPNRKQNYPMFSQQYLTFGSDDDFYANSGDFTYYTTHHLFGAGIGVTFEYGTLDSQTTLGSVESLRRMINENQGHWHGYSKTKVEKSIKNEFAEQFNPSDESWRAKVLKQTNDVFSKMADYYQLSSR